MRKDLKIGMAIGAVLLVVLVVYFAMPKPEGTEVAGPNPEGSEPALTEDQGAPAQGEPATPPTEQPAEQPAERSSPPVVAEAPAQPGDPFAKDAQASTSEPDEEAADGEGGGTNWAKLLDSGDFAPLRTATPTLADRGTDARNGGIVPTGDARPAASEAVSAVTGAAGSGGSDAAAVPAGASQAPTTLLPDNAAPTLEAPAAQPAQPGGSARTHTIQPGENYSTIAKLLYGSSRHYLDIEKANPGVDARRLRPGDVIKLPDPASIKRNGSGDDGATAERQIDPEKEYVVKSNDSLYKIAIERYGSSNMVDEIYELNKEAIGPDQARLKLGMVLKMPPNPAGAANPG